MKSKKPIESLIINIRSQKVILDADLAEIYDVPTKVSTKRSNGMQNDFQMISVFD